MFPRHSNALKYASSPLPKDQGLQNPCRQGFHHSFPSDSSSLLILIIVAAEQKWVILKKTSRQNKTQNNLIS